MKGVVQKGEGKDLLLLHGYLSSKESFYPQIAYFSKFYRVTAVDFPGFGENAPLSSPYSLDDYCRWTKETMQSLGIFFPHVIAHSFGGRVAIKCLSRENLFDKAVLCGCAGIVKKRTLAYRAKVRAYRICRKIAPSFAEKRFGSEEYRTLSPVMRESYKKIVNEDLRVAAESVSRPVLFINGEKDEETPLVCIREYLSRIKGSELRVLKDCGHFAHLDDPLAFHLAVEEFFS
ncbi:MAG: alpha/beta hydrolase [Clostridia bacterium]|nr:alpha/beta hydrolase [Clostridia bacterium]